VEHKEEPLEYLVWLSGAEVMMVAPGEVGSYWETVEAAQVAELETLCFQKFRRLS
jgi:hypothetical protein